MERLRLGYLAKSESQGLRRDMGELLEIKRQVREHLTQGEGPARTHVTSMPEHQAGRFPVPDWSTAAPQFHSQPQQQQFQQQQSQSPDPWISSVASPHFSFFNPLSGSQTSSSSSSVARPASSAGYPSSAAVQANAVPTPYHYFVHEAEVLAKVQGENKQQQQRNQSASGGRNQNSSVRAR